MPSQLRNQRRIAKKITKNSPVNQAKKRQAALSKGTGRRKLIKKITKNSPVNQAKKRQRQQAKRRLV